MLTVATKHHPWTTRVLDQIAKSHDTKALDKLTRRFQHPTLTDRVENLVRRIARGLRAADR